MQIRTPKRHNPAALVIRPAAAADQDAVWAMLEPVFRAGETYVIDPAIGRDAALAYWYDARTFLAEDDGTPLGTYYLRDNQPGGGAHVCNAGFVTAPAAQGRGVARAMLDHALVTATELGYRAMQFNFVVATNTRAVATWQRAGFDIVGRLPGAFRHPAHGYVDALVMYKDLT
ncbi:GNAT family N-acetyltransferase [Pseudooceanicola lipolyticus]|uniref:GNAT family N-acetyltransferase n=1 Tax=Pseudooceanicola lipolyticus TaxID=2029104 RepID=A0A2M8IVU1_9RHOB|nr:GNAT family N-acetyltransferase [Pseudooceanicola lipolyticus]PJE34644.1 GNAT family N-acetyltransferase [Pseudooceanicola lipolyticus]